MTRTTSTLLYFSGWPSCGHAHYGEWLAAHYDFQHLNLETDPAQASDLHDLWEKITVARAPAFAARMVKQHPRWVVTGPAPTDCLPRLEALQGAGFSLWFFLARTEGLSRQRWLAHEREVDPEARPVGWEKQASAIRNAARGLRPFFRDKCIETLVGGGELIDGHALAERIGLKPPK